MNELCNGSFKGSLVAFADDTALFYKSNSLDQLYADMQSDLTSLRWWFTKSCMIMSPKTKYIIFNVSRTIKFPNELKYHNLSCNENLNCFCPSIEQVEEIKYLGLILDSRVAWKNHVTYLMAKLIKYIRIFYLLRSLCEISLLKEVYYALVNSKLEYGLVLWGGSYSITLKPIILLQKAFIRILSWKAKLEHSAPLFKQLYILPLKNLYVYKVLRVFFDRSSSVNQVKNLRKETLRNKLDVSVPKPNKTHFIKFYSYLAPKFFNLLPNELKQCEVRTRFLKSVKKFLMGIEDVETFFQIIS